MDSSGIMTFRNRDEIVSYLYIFFFIRGVREEIFCGGWVFRLGFRLAMFIILKGVKLKFITE